MFEAAELGQTVSPEEYEKQEPEMRTRLLQVQADLLKAKFPVLIVIAGVDGAGKGETVNLLHEWMDPRHLVTRAFGLPSDEEAERPEYWRFWRALPPKGRIGIFFGSWYTRPIVDRVYKRMKDDELDAALERIKNFETLLADDGTLLIKIWFHLSKKAQEKRLRTLEKDPRTRWRVTKLDWEHFDLYDRFRKVSERTLRETNSGKTPWFIVEGADAHHRSLAVGRYILDAISQRLAAIAADPPPAARAAAKKKKAASNGSNVLANLDLTLSLSKKEYEKDLEKYQGRLNLLCRKAQAEKVSSLVLFEGWDAAGKGSLIRRFTQALDARQYQVIPIAAPSDEERAQPYLWRFWRHLPRAGRLTIFDRTWYGRVLVERVEGFAREDDWMRAYREINEFEEELKDHGIVIVKFWIHIDKAEQLRRFKEREQVPWKQYKITPEDYRNREKWDDYEAAVQDMVEKTSTEFAPWTLLEGNDKRYARIKGLKVLCNALEEAVE